MSLVPFQQALKGLGYDPGPVDGIWGFQTERATQELLYSKGSRGRAPVKSPVTAPPSGRLIYQGAARYPVAEIVLHCSDTRPEWMQGGSFGLAHRFRELRRWHMQDRGWSDIGYHWVIDRDGELMPGRTEGTIGAGVLGHNSGVIHICLLGGYGSAETDQFAEHFTAQQARAVLSLIGRIAGRTKIARISGHNEWAAKACPGFNVPTWLKEQAA